MNKRLALTLALTLGACSFIPERPKTDAQIPAQWPGELQTVIPADDKVTFGGTAPAGTAPVLPPLSEDSWRNFFTETALQQIIGAALKGNRDLAIAVGRVDEARALAGLAAAERWPQIDLTAQRNAVLTPGTIRRTFSSGINQRYDIGLATSYEADFWGRVASLDAAAKANFLASDFARRAFRITLIGDVASAWYTLDDVVAREALQEDTVAARVRTLELTTARRDVGLAGELDVLGARASRDTAASELAALRRARVNGENALRLLVGGPLDPAWLPVPARADVEPALPRLPSVAIGLPATALLRRPDIMVAEQKIAAAGANIGAARAAFLPRILLTASLGTASSQLTDLFSAGSRTWAFTPTLRLPLFDAGRREDSVDLATVRQNIAVAEYERSIEQAFREVADVLAVVRYGGEQTQTAYAAAATLAKRLALIDARYRAGLANSLELLDAQREHQSARAAQFQARRQIFLAAAALYKAVGGFDAVPAANPPGRADSPAKATP